MKYSIIIPAYNAEKYIARCIQSIINQNYKDLEMIIVNDGSNDLTLEILKGYDCDFLKIISVENGGVSRARNIGLNHAKGDFIIFVDSDDFLRDDFFARLDDINPKKGCTYVFDYQKVIGDVAQENITSNIKNVIISKQEVLNFCVKSNCNPYKNTRFNTVWGKLFDRNVLNKVRFDENLSVGEDALFFLEAAILSERVIYINCLMYFYFENEDSITHSYKQNMYRNECIWQKKFTDILDKYNITGQENVINYCIYKGLLNNLYLEILNNNSTSDQQKIVDIRELLNKDLYKHNSIIRKVYFEFSKKDQLTLLILKMHLYVIIPPLYRINWIIRKKLRKNRKDLF